MSEPMKIDIVERLLNDRPNEAMMREAVGEIRRLRAEVTLRTDQFLALDAAMTERDSFLEGQLKVAVEALDEIREGRRRTTHSNIAGDALARIREMGGNQ